MSPSSIIPVNDNNRTVVNVRQSFRILDSTSEWAGRQQFAACLILQEFTLTKTVIIQSLFNPHNYTRLHES